MKAAPNRAEGAVAALAEEARDLLAAEREAIADEPRPGVWRQSVGLFEPGAKVPGDDRALTQDQTDCLIACELERRHDVHHSLLATWRRSVQMTLDRGGCTAREQRGGIHSDPLVRLLAYRAWGDRDRRWPLEGSP
jgi:hypothetical protein